jgi:hypothetical protein
MYGTAVEKFKRPARTIVDASMPVCTRRATVL